MAEHDDLHREPLSRVRERLAAAALAERERTQARERVSVAVLALLLVALPLTGLVAVHVGQRAPSGAATQPPTVPMTTVAQGLGISGRAAVTDHTWGSEFFVQTEGPPGDDRFTLLAHGRDGRREQAAVWRNDEDGRVRCRGTTSIRQADLARVSVVSEEGHELLVLDTEQD